jgi:hypothetical protein
MCTNALIGALSSVCHGAWGRGFVGNHGMGEVGSEKSHDGRAMGVRVCGSQGQQAFIKAP